MNTGENMESSNSDKSITGSNVKKALHEIITNTCQKFNNCFEYKSNVKMGADGKNQTQFYIDSMLTFSDSIWLIKATNSYRSDRIKGDEFNVEQIKKILSSKEDKSLLAFFVLPDSLSDKDKTSIDNLRVAVVTKSNVTYFDDVLLMSEFKTKLELKCSALFNQGTRSNILGDIGEASIVDAFTNKNNLDKWNNTPGNNSLVSSDYKLFYEILTQYGISPITQIKEIRNVKTGIKQFMNTNFYDEDLNCIKNGGGKPKTDVSITIITENNQEETLNISVKRPNSLKTNNITIHEGSVEKLISDLSQSIPADSKFNDPSEFELLKNSLLDFQLKGNLKNMNEIDKNYLNDNLPEINNWLIGYFIFGINNFHFTTPIQTANLLVTINPNSGIPKAQNLNTLTNHLLNQKMKSFNTPFSWTYPSGKRGNKIQIKCPVQFD